MFDKMKSDVLEAYFKANNIKFNKGKQEFTQITHDVNAILFSLLDSYYFENKFDIKFVKANVTGKDYYFINGISSSDEDSLHIKIDDENRNKIIQHFEKENENLSTFRKLALKNGLERGVVSLSYDEVLKIIGACPSYAYPKKIDCFNYMYDIFNEESNGRFPENSPYDKYVGESSIISNSKMELTMEELKKDRKYEVLLETDPVKRIINIKNRKDFEFDIIDVEDPCDISKYLQFEYDYYLFSALKEVYSIKYLSSRDCDYKLLVAHNEFEMAGNLAITDMSTYEKPIKSGIAAYVNHIEVASPFYGNKLGVRLMEEAIKYAENNNLILFRTSPSNLGSTYIKDKIDSLALKSKTPIVSSQESNIITKIIYSLKDKNNSEIINTVGKALLYIRENLDEKDLSYGLRDKEVIEKCTILTSDSRNKPKL